MEEYLRGDSVQHRGGKGLKNHNITEKTGAVAAVKLVSDEDDILTVSNDGTPEETLQTILEVVT